MVKRRNLAVGGLAIAGISYLAGILTAPKSGRETRRDIKKAAKQAKSETEKALKNAHSDLTELVEKASKVVATSKTKTAEGLKSALEQAQVVKQKTRELLSAIHEGEADDKELKKALDEAKKAASHLKKFLAG